MQNCIKTLLTLSCVLLAAACTQSKYYAFSGFTQGGNWTAKVNLEGVVQSPQTIYDSINAILTLVDTTFSGYNKNSILSRRNAGHPVPVNSAFEQLTAISEAFIEQSGGAFDIYAAPLFDIWGFGFTSGQYPSDSLVRVTLDSCKTHRQINFNAIAQGYTCDLVADYLDRAGANDYLVDIGEIACKGLNPAGKPWTISIDTPTDGNNTPGAQTSGLWQSPLGRCGIVTSGNYRKFYIIDGKKYSHTIDPRTGYPVTHKLLSATVVAPNATTADALATWFMVIGPDLARTKILEMPDIEACLISSDTIWLSPNFVLPTPNHPQGEQKNEAIITRQASVRESI